MLSLPDGKKSRFMIGNGVTIIKDEMKLAKKEDSTSKNIQLIIDEIGKVLTAYNLDNLYIKMSYKGEKRYTMIVPITKILETNTLKMDIEDPSTITMRWVNE